MEFESEPLSGIQLFWFNHGPELVSAYFWILFIVGLLLSLYAYYRTRVFGYLLVAVYFCFPIINYGIDEVSYRLHREEYERIAAVKNEEIEQMRERGEPIVIERNVNLPIFETFLVLGLFFLSRSHSRLKSEPVAGGQLRSQIKCRPPFSSL